MNSIKLAIFQLANWLHWSKQGLKTKAWTWKVIGIVILKLFKVNIIFNGYLLERQVNPSGEKAMQNSIWEIFFRLIQNETKSQKQQHRFCPQDSEFWYKFCSDHENFKDSGYARFLLAVNKPM